MRHRLILLGRLRLMELLKLLKQKPKKHQKLTELLCNWLPLIRLRFTQGRFMRLRFIRYRKPRLLKLLRLKDVLLRLIPSNIALLFILKLLLLVQLILSRPTQLQFTVLLHKKVKVGTRLAQFLFHFR